MRTNAQKITHISQMVSASIPLVKVRESIFQPKEREFSLFTQSQKQEFLKLFIKPQNLLRC